MTVPTARLLLDDGTGTYPTDISGRVEWDESATISSYGRTDEFDQAQSAQLGLTLDNTDGLVSTGIGFDLAPFDTTPFGGAGLLAVEQGIRLQVTVGATTRNRFTGKIATLELAWPGGSDARSLVELTAMDPLTECARRTLRSMLEEEVLLRAPSAYYTLGEAEGSTTAGDTSGSQAPVLTMAGSGMPVTFGQATGPGVDGLTAASFAAGQFLVSSQDVPAAHTQIVAFSRSGAPSSPEVLATANNEFLVIETTGHVSIGKNGLLGHAPIVTSTTNLCDGSVHLVGWATSPGNGFTLFANGTSAFGADASAGSLGSAPLSLGAQPGLLALDLTVIFTGNLSHAASFAGVLSTADFASINAMVSGATETTTARHARLASYGGLTTTTTAGMSGQLVAAQATTGRSLADALQENASAEGGFLYANGDGALVLQGRGYRAGKTTADLTVTSADIGSDVAPTVDTQQRIDQVTVTRTGGATQVAGSGSFPTDLTLSVASDGDALRAAQWIVAKHSDPGPRIGSVSIDAYAAPNGEDIFNMEIGDRVTLDNLPAQMWTGAGDVTVEGWTETITDSSWEISANVLPWSLFTALILDDPVYGVLDSFPIAN